MLTSLYVSAQNVLPQWVRGRGLAIFLTVIFGSVAVGSAALGAGRGRSFGLDHALIAAVGRRARRHPADLALEAARRRGDRPHALPPLPAARNRRRRSPTTAGPILVKIEYWIDPKDRDRFLRAIDDLGEQRRRDGAFAWGVFEDMAAFGRFEEAYLIESWLELMHFRERITREDRAIEDEIRDMLTDAAAYRVSRRRRARARCAPYGAARPLERDRLRVLVVYAHPLADQLSSRRPTSGSSRRCARGGHEVDDLDLYAEPFDPVLSPGQMRGYVDTAQNTREVEPHVAAAAGGRGAGPRLPGLVRRPAGDHAGLFPEGVRAGGRDRHRRGRPLPSATSGTSGASPRSCAYGETPVDVAEKLDPPRRFVRDNIGVLIDPDGRFDYYALYDMNFSKAPRRTAFLRRVERAFSAW